MNMVLLDGRFFLTDFLYLGWTVNLSFWAFGVFASLGKSGDYGIAIGPLALMVGKTQFPRGKWPTSPQEIFS